MQAGWKDSLPCDIAEHLLADCADEAGRMCLTSEAAIAQSDEYAFALLDDLEKYEVFPCQRFGKELLIY